MPTFVFTIHDEASGGRLSRIAVRAGRQSEALRLLRDAGIHKRAIVGQHPAAQELTSVPWPGDDAVEFLRQRLGLGEDPAWVPITSAEL